MTTLTLALNWLPVIVLASAGTALGAIGVGRVWQLATGEVLALAWQVTLSGAAHIVWLHALRADPRALPLVTAGLCALWWVTTGLWTSGFGVWAIPLGVAVEMLCGVSLSRGPATPAIVDRIAHARHTLTEICIELRVSRSAVGVALRGPEPDTRTPTTSTREIGDRS